jgi:hypothetical protein
MILLGNEDLLTAIYDQEYEESPVDAKTFFTDPYYLGVTGGDLYPQVLDDLCEIFNPERNYLEVILGGAIGWGKSTEVEFGLLRCLYEIACLRNPQRSFGLMEGSSIVIINLSVTEQQARKAIFSGLLAKVRQSPFFKNNFAYDPTVVSELRFPKGITVFPGASTDNSILGLNVVAGAVDETNFMPIMEVRKTAGGRSAGVYDKAASLYNAMIRRMKSRFLRHGRLPGKMFSLSSAQYPNDFIERKVRQALSDTTIFARRYALWDVKREQFSTQTFPVEVGTDLSGSRVLYPGDQPTGKVIDVPVDFRPDFEKDCDGSLRDIAGVSTLTVDQFIKDFGKVVECVNEKRRHAFTKEFTTLEDGAKLRLSTLLKENPQNPRWKPVLIHNPESLRVVHIDPSLTRDATGIAVGHISDMVRVVRRQDDGTEKVEWAPFIVYDLLLRIVPPRHREIQYDRIRDIIYRLQEVGMRIGFVSMDSFQTAEMRQQLTRRRIPNDVLSIDRTTEPYEILKAALYEKRVDLYPYPVAMKELRQLEHDRLKGKIDHPEHGSKDVSDAMAGVAYILTLHAARFYKPKVSVSTFG